MEKGTVSVAKYPGLIRIDSPNAQCVHQNRNTIETAKILLPPLFVDSRAGGLEAGADELYDTNNEAADGDGGCPSGGGTERNVVVTDDNDAVDKSTAASTSETASIRFTNQPIPARLIKPLHRSHDISRILRANVLYSPTDEYKVIGLIGCGSFGKVAKCWKQSNCKIVAVKILIDGFRQGQLEMSILTRLNEENAEEYGVVRFYECFQYMNLTCLVFEMLGENLLEFVQHNNNSPIPLMYIRLILRQILKALCKLKEVGVIHADLKPENIMFVDSVAQPYRVKLIDFGCAIPIIEAPFIKRPYLQSRYYRSPEIILGLPFSEAIDVWSLGCIAAELFLGSPLYPGENEFDQIRYISQTQGSPAQYLLNNGSKTIKYFGRSYFSGEWQLKSVKQHEAETRIRSTERRKFVFNCLDEIVWVNWPVNLEGNRLMDEKVNRREFLDLLKSFLAIDQFERITPNEALQHSFTSLTQSNSQAVTEQLMKLPKPVGSQASSSEWHLNMANQLPNQKQPLPRRPLAYYDIYGMGPKRQSTNQAKPLVRHPPMIHKICGDGVGHNQPLKLQNESFPTATNQLPIKMSLVRGNPMMPINESAEVFNTQLPQQLQPLCGPFRGSVVCGNHIMAMLRVPHQTYQPLERDLPMVHDIRRTEMGSDRNSTIQMRPLLPGTAVIQPFGNSTLPNSQFPQPLQPRLRDFQNIAYPLPNPMQPLVLGPPIIYAVHGNGVGPNLHFPQPLQPQLNPFENNAYQFPNQMQPIVRYPPMTYGVCRNEMGPNLQFPRPLQPRLVQFKNNACQLPNQMQPLVCGPPMIYDFCDKQRPVQMQPPAFVPVKCLKVYEERIGDYALPNKNCPPTTENTDFNRGFQQPFVPIPSSKVCGDHEVNHKIADNMICNTQLPGECQCVVFNRPQIDEFYENCIEDHASPQQKQLDVTNPIPSSTVYPSVNGSLPTENQSFVMMTSARPSEHVLNYSNDDKLRQQPCREISQGSEPSSDNRKIEN